jgi:hypothetical protein
MRNFRLASWIALLWCAGVAPALAQIKPETLRAGKAATALVVLPSGRGFASSFGVDERGYFITNRHAIGDGAALKLVLNAGEDNERTLDAKLLRKDDALDLALLQVADNEKLPALPLAEKGELLETQPIIVFGYPFGTALNVKEQEYPNVSVNVGRITSLRKSSGRLEMIQTDAEVNRGNSGGPLLSEAGEVLGVVTAKVNNTNVSFAIPAERVREFLARPELALDPIQLAHANRYDAQPFRVRLTTFAAKPPDYRLQLKLGQGASLRAFDLKPSDEGRYQVDASLLPKRDGDEQLPIEVVLKRGLVRGEIADAKLAGAAARLAEVRSIERRGEEWLVVGRDQKQTTLKKPPLRGGIAVKLGDVDVVLPWESVKSVAIYQPDAEPASVPYEVVALVDDKPVANLRGEFAITGRPAPEFAASDNPPPAGDYRPPTTRPKIGDDKLVVRLSSPYRDCIVGGSGRYFIAHLPAEKKIAVFDVVAGRIVHELNDVSDDAIIAASREKLIVALPGQKLMQRYDLATMEREKVAPLPGKGITLRALLGANSDGPLLLGAEDAQLVDLQTLEPLVVKGELIGAGKGLQIHPSYDGQTLAGIPTGYGPVAYTRCQLNGTRATRQNFSSTSHATRYAWPTADGRLIAVTGSALFGPLLEEVPAKWLDGATIFPSVDPRYFIAVRPLLDERQKKHVCHVHVCTTSERQIVGTFVGFEEVGKEASDWQASLTNQVNEGQERFHYLPWAGAIVALSYGNQEFVVQRYDLLQQLEQSGVEFLFVDSLPPFEATRGDTLRYPIAVKSKSAAITYRLETGPDGATISDDGVVTWNIPRETSDAHVQFIVAIKNGGGKEILHSFSVKLNDAVTIVDETP